MKVFTWFPSFWHYPSPSPTVNLSSAIASETDDRQSIYEPALLHFVHTARSRIWIARLDSLIENINQGVGDRPA